MKAEWTNKDSLTSGETTKAILVVDIPDHINSVNNGILKPIGTVGKLEICYGSDDGEITGYIFIDTDGALLKPMPQKLHESRPMYGGSKDIVIGERIDEYSKGYNECLKEILGEE